MPAHPDAAVRGVLAVVPVSHDDPAAPLGCAALRELNGQSLVGRAVAALRRTGRVDAIVLPVPPALAEAIRQQLSPAAGAPPAEVLPVPGNSPGQRVLAALRRLPAGERRPVLVHDPLHALAPVPLIRTVLDGLCPDPGPTGGAARGGGAGATRGGTPGARAAADGAAEAAGRELVVPVRPVTDTLKWVDESGVVTTTADRAGYRMVYGPQAGWSDWLLAVLGDATAEELARPGAQLLPELVQACGGWLRTVPAPGEVFRIAVADDLLFAEAMLHAEEDEAGAGPRQPVG